MLRGFCLENLIKNSVIIMPKIRDLREMQLLKSLYKKSQLFNIYLQYIMFTQKII